MIFFNAVCDVSGCKTLQPMYFESDNDTFGEAKNALALAGWRIASGLCHKDYILICPQHKKESFENLKFGNDYQCKVAK